MTRIHPLVAGAAISIILVSLVGVAAHRPSAERTGHCARQRGCNDERGRHNCFFGNGGGTARPVDIDR